MAARKYAFPLLAAAGAGAGLYYYNTNIASAAQKAAAPAPKAFTDPNQWIDLKLKSFKDVSPDSREFFFELPSPDQVSGLETASLLLAKYVTEKGNNVIRPYTPISDPDHKGELQFVIKRYPNGKFGNHLFNLKPGQDTVSFKGPIQKWKWVPNQFEEITLIGGGSGITPLHQLLTTIAKNPEDKTKVHLIYGNKTPEDILLREDLDRHAKESSDQVKVTYFVDKPNDDYKGEVGFITKEYLEKHIPKPSDKTHAFVCGPDGLYKAVSGNKASKTDQGEVTGALAELGYTKDHVFKF